jgi:hypothetical protein
MKPFFSHNISNTRPLVRALARLSQIWQEKIIFLMKAEGSTLQVGHTSIT